MNPFNTTFPVDQNRLQELFSNALDRAFDANPAGRSRERVLDNYLSVLTSLRSDALLMKESIELGDGPKNTGELLEQLRTLFDWNDCLFVPTLCKVIKALTVFTSSCFLVKTINSADLGSPVSSP